MSANVTVRVPGSTANLGSGFDCIGIAIDRWVRVVARHEASDAPVRLERHGALEGVGVPAARDLLYLGFVRACQAAGREPPGGLVLEASSDIPVARGLGSSAAAVVAGAVTARALCELDLDDAALIAACAGVEGHADNVAPSVLGGAILVLETGTRQLLFTPREVHASLVLIFAVPDFTLSTEEPTSLTLAGVSFDI